LTAVRLSGDRQPVSELHNKHQFWQLVAPIEPTPTFMRRFDKFEDHGERGAIRETSLRGGARLRTCFSMGFVFASQRPIAILVETFGCLLVFDLVALDECVEPNLGVTPSVREDGEQLIRSPRRRAAVSTGIPQGQAPWRS
jgi:hypothetical protein